jgi:hypothetical protein
MSFIRNPTPPRLPDPESDYSPRWLAALLQALRLYFEQLNNFTQAVLGRNGGRFLEVPTASFYADADQVLVAATPTAVLVPLLLNVEGFTHPTASKIQADHSGTYSIRATLSVRNADAAAQPFKVWFRKNAVDRPTSTVEFTIPAGATVPVVAGYLGDLLPTDTFEIMVFAASANVRLYAPPVAGPVPRGAAARIDVVFESNDSTAGTTSALFRVKKLVAEPAP